MQNMFKSHQHPSAKVGFLGFSYISDKDSNLFWYLSEAAWVSLSWEMSLFLQSLKIRVLFGGRNFMTTTSGSLFPSVMYVKG